MGPNRQSVEASREMLMRTQQEALRQMENRPVYPYSVVSGGVRDVAELKWAADHDPVVKRHYWGSTMSTRAWCAWCWPNGLCLVSHR